MADEEPVFSFKPIVGGPVEGSPSVQVVPGGEITEPQPKFRPLLDTSYPNGVPTRSSGEVLGPVTGNISRVRDDAAESFNSAGWPSITRPGVRSMFTPGLQEKIGPVGNAVGDVIGTGWGDVKAVGSGAVALGNEALRSFGVPDPLIRDLNVEVTRRAGEAPTRRPVIAPQDAPAMRELMTPRTPSPWEVRQAELDRANANLRRQQAGVDIPQAPQPFPSAPTPAPTRPAAPGLLGEPVPVGPPERGLLAVPPEAMTRAEMEAQARAGFRPVDQQAAQGATIHPTSADALRKPLVDVLSGDAEKGGYVGDTPLTRMAGVAKANLGKPMTFDAAMELDRQLGAAKRAAQAQPGGADLARQLGEAQDAVQERLFNLKDSEVTGDATVLKNLPDAKQGWLQARKQGQIEDIEYGAGLLPEAKRDAYRRAQLTSMLKNDRKMAGWSADEKGVAEDLLKSGEIGPLTRVGLWALPQAGRVAGAGIGGWFGGTGGAVAGADIGANVARGGADLIRQRLQQLNTERISRQLTANMPPPPQGWAP